MLHCDQFSSRTREVIFQIGETVLCDVLSAPIQDRHQIPKVDHMSGDSIMKKIIASTLVALSVLSGVATIARADYFGTTKEAQQGQHAEGVFGQIEKSGI